MPVSVPWEGSVTFINVTLVRGDAPVSVMDLGPVVATSWELATAKPGTWVGAVMAFSIEAMVLTSAVYWDEVGLHLPR